MNSVAALCFAGLFMSTTAFVSTPIGSLRRSAGLPIRRADSRSLFRPVLMQQVQERTEQSVEAPVKKNPVRPPVGLIDLITKYAWGMQDPQIPLPIPVVDGQPPEHCPKVTQEHLDTLARDGVVHIKGVLDQKWIDYLREVTEWQIKHPHVWAIPGVVSNLYDYIQVSIPPATRARRALVPAARKERLPVSVCVCVRARARRMRVRRAL